MKILCLMSQELEDFNPNGVGIVGDSFFSLPCSVDSSRVVIISAPWDVTVSYGAGCAAAPHALMEASSQLDLYDSSAVDAWREGIATYPVDPAILERSTELRKVAERVIFALESGAEPCQSDLDLVNEGSKWLNDNIYSSTLKLLNQGKIVALVGGDHSTPYGAIKALSEVHDSFAILHIDAHRDLRKAYEGFKYSHASIMYNILRDIEQVERIVQVGVRDFCDDEQALATTSQRVVSFEDMTLARARFEGESWGSQCRRIVETLPQKVYVSFDIDGLEMSFCPHTGTPVSGGLSYNEAIYLLEILVESGREIIGLDLVEVVPSEGDILDLIVGARVLYKLSGLSIKSNYK